MDVTGKVSPGILHDASLMRSNADLPPTCELSFSLVAGLLYVHVSGAEMSLGLFPASVEKVPGKDLWRLKGENWDGD